MYHIWLKYSQYGKVGTQSVSGGMDSKNIIIGNESANQIFVPNEFFLPC